MTRIQNMGNAKLDAEYQEPLLIAAENAKWPSYFRRQFVTFLQTVHNLSYGPAISLLDLYPTDLKTYVHTKTYMGYYKRFS